ncbi:MAG: nucleoside-diphosphate sugar epimerase/dehydratase [Alphaproteobacteria bacterium]
MQRRLKTTLAFAHDLLAAALAFLLGMFLRHGEAIRSLPAEHILGNTLLFTAISGIVFLLSGLYRGIWAYASVRDLWAILRGVSLAVLVFLPVSFLMTRLADIPRTTPVIVWLILLAFLCGSRMFYRLIREGRLNASWAQAGEGQSPVLLYGAGDAADLFIRALASNPHAPYRVIGVIAENDRRVGRELHGVKVLGTIEQLPQLMTQWRARDQAPSRLILTCAAPGDQRDALLEFASQQGVLLSRLPELTNLQDATIDTVAERPIVIEDLLGRAETVLEREAIKRLVAGRRVLVTGGGGTIGGELCRQIAALDPAQLDIVEIGEFNLYTIELELCEKFPDLLLQAWLGDVRDPLRLKEIFTQAKPELVFHAAALKHVPIAEENVRETVLTNVLGSKLVADCAQACGALATVLISTDKAVNPTSVMGATKRVAELYFQNQDIACANSKAHCLSVRFGNVLGSTGSVVPRFRAQLAKGGPLTVTHPDMSRFFMTVREAVELVLQASAFATRPQEQRGALLVLDMGTPVKIVDLARQMIRLAGLRPDIDVKITYTGLRPGEKMHEELIATGENISRAAVDGVNILAAPPQNPTQFQANLEELLRAAASGADAAILRQLIGRLVPEFSGSLPTQKLAG